MLRVDQGGFVGWQLRDVDRCRANSFIVADVLVGEEGVREVSEHCVGIADSVREDLDDALEDAVA